MQQIQGFVTKSNYISNASNAVAEFFELSPFALTYSRARGEYQHPSFVGSVLHTFKTVDLDTGAYFVVTTTQVDEIMRVVESVLSYMTSHAFPYSASDFKDTILATYSGVISEFATSDFYSGATLTLPEWLSWTSTATNTQIKIWLRNISFENQYSDYEIVPVAPVAVLDDFFGNHGSMVNRLATIGPIEVMNMLQEAESGYPETYTRVYGFGFVNPNNLTQITHVYWGVLIYGRNGDNIDSVKEALADYILKNSTHSQADWEIIFPDIFRRTEFLFLPRWDKISIPNLTVLAGLYSPVANPAETLDYAKEMWIKIPVGWLENNITVWPFDYKAVSVVALNGQTNIAGKESLPTLYKDYIPVNTSSVDFSRMEIATRDWVTMMVDLLRTAETATINSSIDNPMRKVVRDQLLYIAVTRGDVNYMVACRSNVKPQLMVTP